MSSSLFFDVGVLLSRFTVLAVVTFSPSSLAVISVVSKLPLLAPFVFECDLASSSSNFHCVCILVSVS